MPLKKGKSKDDALEAVAFQNEVILSGTKKLADAHGYATRLLVAVMEKYYPDRSPDWQPLSDLMGVLTQIDNLTTGLVRSKGERVAGKPRPRKGSKRKGRVAP
jgi:hypothetical protein